MCNRLIYLVSVSWILVLRYISVKSLLFDYKFYPGKREGRIPKLKGNLTQNNI